MDDVHGAKRKGISGHCGLSVRPFVRLPALNDLYAEADVGTLDTALAVDNKAEGVAIGFHPNTFRTLSTRN